VASAVRGRAGDVVDELLKIGEEVHWFHETSSSVSTTDRPSFLKRRKRSERDRDKNRHRSVELTLDYSPRPDGQPGPALH
jgi:hypothetical protein